MNRMQVQSLHRTPIEWVLNADGTQGFSWNPVVGCSHCSPGCDNCYAARLAATRLKTNPRYEGLAVKDPAASYCPRWTGEVREHPDRLPHRWWMEESFKRYGVPEAIQSRLVPERPWPLPNVGLMATCCNQAEFDTNVAALMRCPAAWRGVSLEPLLGGIDITGQPALDWYIVGGETGPHARDIPIIAVGMILGQCTLGFDLGDDVPGLPFFFKKWGSAMSKADTPIAEMPREMPAAWHAWAKELAA